MPSCTFAAPMEQHRKRCVGGMAVAVDFAADIAIAAVAVGDCRDWYQHQMIQG